MLNIPELKNKLGNSFNKRWNISTKVTKEEEFNKFKIRILNVLSNIDSLFDHNQITLFCQLRGIAVIWHTSSLYRRSFSTNIKDSLEKESNPLEFIRLLETILSLEFRDLFTFNTCKEQIATVLSLSNIDVGIGITNHGIIFYPKGEKLLDEQVINKTLSFLSDNSLTLFEDALKEYQKHSQNTWKSAESLRKCLEEFLRQKFNNSKNYSENKQDLGVKLKDKKVDPQIRNLIMQILSYLDQYFNDNTKHKTENISKDETEFLIYQVGLILKHLNTIL